MVFLFKKRTLRCLHGGFAALISLLLLRSFAEKPQERVIFKGGVPAAGAARLTAGKSPLVS